MEIVNVHEAKTHLSRIMERVAAGEEIVLAKAGRPMVVMRPYVDPGKVRKPGVMKGRIRLAEDFDSVDELIADLFEGVDGQAE